MTQTTKVLVSACLLGERVRYDGGSQERDDDVLRRWRDEGRVVPICPEVAGGLGVPRAPAEIVGGDGAAVLDDEATVRTDAGSDVTDAFLSGARHALEVARARGLRIAVLKERSPSCGRDAIYDGTFSGTLTAGAGVTAALLERHGIDVFGESELEAADARVRELDAQDAS